MPKNAILDEGDHRSRDQVPQGLCLGCQVGRAGAAKADPLRQGLWGRHRGVHSVRETKPRGVALGSEKLRRPILGVGQMEGEGLAILPRTMIHAATCHLIMLS